MLKTIRIVMVLAVLCFFVGGCVSSGSFKKMEAQKNGEIAQLQQQNSALNGQRQALEQERSQLQVNVNDLKQQLASLEQKKTEMEQQTASLQQEKAAMVSTSQQQQQQYEMLVRKLSTEAAKGQVQVRRYKNMLTVDLAEKIFFDSGRATLKTEGKAVLKKVGEALKGYDSKLIWVVGHTDNVPVAKSLQATFPTNWELSVARATNVVRFLQDNGVPPERMVSSGRAQYDPIGSNDTPEDRQKNRRIEIMLIDQALVNELSTPGS